MRTAWIRRLTVGVLALIWAWAPASPAETIVLDSDDVLDWARTLSSYTWKQKDTALQPNSLLKFDLSRVPAGSEIAAAHLHMFVERAEGDPAVEFWYVEDDSWSYAYTEPAELWSWPVRSLIATRVFSDSTSFSLDVTGPLREEMLSGDGRLSIKIAGQSYPRVRLASPRAPLERMRPRIVVEYAPPPGPSPLADLAVSAADIGMTPMRALPGQTVTLRARVRNIGSADAWDVPVAFYEGAPAVTNPPIGICIVPHLSAGGGAAMTAVLWSAGRGLREIHVVADFEGAIAEGNEANNAALRVFSIEEAEAYERGLESFEWPGRFAWHADFDVPKQFEYPGPKSFYVNHSPGEAYHGEQAMELYLDGTADDGTIWIETAVPVEPFSHVEVAVDFQLFRYEPDIAFIPVVAVCPFDPEMEEDFQYVNAPSQAGWTLHEHETTLFTGPYDLVHIAVGLTCTWETAATFFIDLVRTRVREVPAGIGDADRAGPGAGARLHQSAPNPGGPLATIAFDLAAPGPVALRIFDMSGRHVVTLRDGPEPAGRHQVRWDGTDALGRAVPAGVYFYTLHASGEEESRKLLLAR